MDFKNRNIIAKDGKSYTVRRAEISDAEAVLKLLRITAEQSVFLLREPDEVTMTVEQEQAFIQQYSADSGTLLLLLEQGEQLLGLCSVAPVGPFRRYAHRCGVAIALHRDVWGLNLGRNMMEILLTEAKQVGYEQAELDVIADNHRAVALYKRLGFEQYGVMPRNMQYTDGTYADAIWMMKKL